MWATYPKMQEALDLIEAWGFKYKSIAFQWIKQNRSGNGYFFGLGRWTRGNTEPCLIAIKGKPKRISAGVGQLVFSPLRRHSQKPAEVREKIVELMGDLPRIELFAREVAIIIAPDLIEQFVARQRFTLIMHQEQEQVIRGFREDYLAGKRKYGIRPAATSSSVISLAVSSRLPRVSSIRRQRAARLGSTAS